MVAATVFLDKRAYYRVYYVDFLFGLYQGFDHLDQFRRLSLDVWFGLFHSPKVHVRASVNGYDVGVLEQLAVIVDVVCQVTDFGTGDGINFRRFCVGSEAKKR